jgi:hypothetical protein
MVSLNDKQTELFEERLADLFRAIIMTSEEVSNLIQKNNILVKLELCTYLFWVLDYSLVSNKVDQAIRSEINKMFDEMFSLSKHWRGLQLKDQGRYIDDRLNNYTDIIRAEKGFSTKYYERIIEYQVELIAWILKNKEVRLDFIAVPKKKADYQPIELGLLSKYNIMVPLQEAYIRTMLPLISKIKRNSNISYFIDRQYEPK